MERKIDEAMESFFKTVGVPVFKTLRLKGGEYIYGSNLFIPATEQSLYNIARGINVLQHLRHVGENVPMNIWVCVSIDKFNFMCKEWYNGVCPNLYVYRYKTYFYKDIVNQDVTDTLTIKNYLENSEYDVDDGSVYTTYVTTDIEKIKEEIKQKTRYFKVKIDNGCLERWINRYLNEIGEFDLFNADEFTEELKNPKVLKDYIEPVKEIPSKLQCMIPSKLQTQKTEEKQAPKTEKDGKDGKNFEVILYRCNGKTGLTLRGNGTLKRNTVLSKLIESDLDNDMVVKIDSYSFYSELEAHAAMQMYETLKNIREMTHPTMKYPEKIHFRDACDWAVKKIPNCDSFNNMVSEEIHKQIWGKQEPDDDNKQKKDFINYFDRVKYLCSKEGQADIEKRVPKYNDGELEMTADDEWNIQYNTPKEKAIDDWTKWENARQEKREMEADEIRNITKTNVEVKDGVILFNDSKDEKE